MKVVVVVVVSVAENKWEWTHGKGVVVKQQKHKYMHTLRVYGVSLKAANEKNKNIYVIILLLPTLYADYKDKK